MVRLLEFEVKTLLKKLQLPLPQQFHSEELNDPAIYPIVLKSQVPIGGRRKLGGIRFANNQSEAKKYLQELTSLKIKEFLPKIILIEEKLPILKEYYCGFVVNRNEKQFNFIFSEFGGIDIEEVSKESQKRYVFCLSYHLIGILTTWQTNYWKGSI